MKLTTNNLVSSTNTNEKVNNSTSSVETPKKPSSSTNHHDQFNIENSTGKYVNTVTLLNPRSEALKAELLWCLEVIAKKALFKSCNNKKQLFSVMFPGLISESFNLSESKAKYLITDALAPYFKEQLLT